MFSGSKYAGIVSTVIYFIGVLVNKALSPDDVASQMNSSGLAHPTLMVTNDGVTYGQKLAASLIPQVAIMQGSKVFSQYETTGVGLDSSTANLLYNDYSFNTALWMLFIDFFLYFILGLYMDKVLPSTYGQR